MRTSFVLSFTALVWLSPGLCATAANWPGWRGADGTGVSSETTFPLRWTTNQNVRWRAALPGPGNSSPIVWGRRVFVTQAVKSENRRTVICFYAINQEGSAECVELSTGKAVWAERLKGAGTKTSSWSSMLLAGQTIYVPNQSGDVFALRASPTFELLSANSIGEPTNASLAASDGQLFLRTDKALWCFAEAK